VEIAESVRLALQNFHFGVEAFGNAVIPGEAPHHSHLRRPGTQGLAELNELGQAGTLQILEGTEESVRQLFALFSRAVFFSAVNSRAAV
jgi:hypothetical protein